MSLHRVVKENMYKLKTTNGSSFYGQLTDIPVTTRVSNFNSPRRLFRVLPKSVLRVGDTFIDPNGRIFLVADHGDQFLKGKHLYTHYKLFGMSDIAAIGREGAKTRDPVSKQLIEGQPVWTQGIYIAFEIRSSGSDNLGQTVKRQQIITGHPIEAGDLIQVLGNSKQAVVERVDKQLGVYIGQIEYE